MLGSWPHDRVTQDWEIDTWTAQREPCAPGHSRKEQWPHKRLTQTFLWLPSGNVVACCRVGGTECSGTCMQSLKKVTIVFITSTTIWPQVNSREGIQLHPSTENRIKHLLSMAPPIRLRPSFSLSQCLPPCLPPGNFHKPLTILHQRVDRLKTTITEN